MGILTAASALALCGFAAVPGAFGAVATAQTLAEKPCGYCTRCFYGRDGKLHHWAKQYFIFIPGGRTFWGNPKPGAERKVFITGGYAAIMREQEEYNAWARARNDPDRAAVPVTGGLNLRTLDIPSYMGQEDVLQLWSRFQEDCKAADAERRFRACRDGFDDYHWNLLRAAQPLEPGATGVVLGPPEDRDEHVMIKSSGATALYVVYSFPDELLRLRAGAIEDAWHATNRFRALVDTLRPLADEWAASYGCDQARLDEKDHVEPEQLPADFTERLAEARRRIRMEINHARNLETVYRKQ